MPFESKPGVAQRDQEERHEYCEHLVKIGVITRHTMDVLMDYNHRYYSYEDRDPVDEAYCQANYQRANLLAKGLQRGDDRYVYTKRRSIF